MNISRIVCGLIVVLGIAGAGCQSSKELPSSGVRPPTSPQQVRIFQNAPREFEVLGPVSLAVTPDVTWDNHGDATVGFDRMKARAAEMGANGLLLRAPGQMQTTVLAGYQGTFYKVPARSDPRTVMVQAIYVIKE